MSYSLEEFCQYLSLAHPPTTVKTYRIGARHLIEYVQKYRVNIHKTPGLLYGFVAYEINELGHGAASVDTYIPGAKKYLSWRRDSGDPLPIYGSPDQPRRPRRIPIVVRAAAMQQFMHLTALDDEPFRTLALLFPFTGLRSDEACTLKLSQVMRNPKDPKRYQFRDVQGKSLDMRTVSILDPGSAILYGYLSGWRRGISGSRWLFPADGDPKRAYNDRTMRRKMDEIEKALGGPKLSAHILRHTWATALADAGVPLHHVAHLAGHRSIQTTYQHYIGAGTDERIGAELEKVHVLQEEGTK